MDSDNNNVSINDENGKEGGNGSNKAVLSAVVRYGRMKQIGEFTYPSHMKFPCGASLVISTKRGIEIGQQISLTCVGPEKAIPREQMLDYANQSGEEYYRAEEGRVLRQATETDLSELRHIEQGAMEKLQTSQRFASEFGLDMKIVDCEHIFGGERIVFYFMAAERVDFRELVRRLASEYQTRIEMRQVGARDEARLLADYETCGRECCCKNYLKTLKPISMQMAKLQKATLDPSKVSGRCGRLKCCLRYEHDIYEDLVKRLPHVGSHIETAHGAGRVVERQILTQLVKIMGDDDRIFTVAVEDILDKDASGSALVLDRDHDRSQESSESDSGLPVDMVLTKEHPDVRSVSVEQPEQELMQGDLAPISPSEPDSRASAPESTKPTVSELAPDKKASSKRKRGRRRRPRRRGRGGGAEKKS